MIALVFLLFILPIALVITAIITGTVIVVDSLYEIGIALYNDKKPVNKYRK